MGTIAEYFCKRCANVFTARAGGGFEFVELRCEACDEIVRVARSEWPVDRRAWYAKIDPDYAATLPEWTPESLAAARAKFRCQKCNAPAREDLEPMCPKCRSREVVQGRPTVHYD